MMDSPLMASELTGLLTSQERHPDWNSAASSSADEEYGAVVTSGRVPNAARSTYGAGSRRSIRRNAKKYARVMSVFLAAAAALAVLLALLEPTANFGQKSSIQQPGQQQQWSSSSERSPSNARAATDGNNVVLGMTDAKMAVWDEWKDKAGAVGGWFRTEASSVYTDAIRSRAQEYGSDVGNWWNVTVTHEFIPATAENAKKFGKQVQSWWSNAADESRSVGSNVEESIEEKERVLESNFQTWWAKASAAEKSWWNATVHTLAHGEQVAGQTLKQDEKVVAKWWNASEHEIAKDTAVAGREIGKEAKVAEQELGKDAKAAGHWIANETKATGEATKHLWDKTTTELSKDEKAAAEKTGEWWHAATGALKNEEEVAAEKTGEWWNAASGAVAEKSQEAWNATKRGAKNDEAFVVEKGKEAWDATKRAVKNDEAFVAEKSEEAWDATKRAVKNDETFVEEKSKEAWQATEKEAARDERAVGKTFVAWWNAAKAGTKSAWNGTVNAEEQWWDVTENWFKDHLRKHVEDPANLPLLYLNSTDAFSLLMNGYAWYDFSSDFFLITSGLDAQINQAYCAVATSAAVINSFRGAVELPVDPMYDPHPYATQAVLVDNHCVNRNVIHMDFGQNSSFDGILHAPGGLSLDQTEKLLACNLPDDWNVTSVHVDPETVALEDVRRDIESVLVNPKQRVLVNYDRKVLGQEGGGHFSPLGSYSKKRDSFLILDVAKYKYPPVWVPAARLYSAMSTLDQCGDWDYPSAQEKLVEVGRRSLSHPHNKSEYAKAMHKLRCEAEYRGYIIVGEPTTSSDNS